MKIYKVSFLTILMEERMTNNSTKNRDFKWLLVGSICGILLGLIYLFLFINSILPEDSQIEFTISGTLSHVLFVGVMILIGIFSYAFYLLGKHKNSKGLSKSAMAVLVLTASFGILSYVFYFWAKKNFVEAAQKFLFSAILGGKEPSIWSLFPGWIWAVIFLTLAALSLSIVAKFILGINLIKLKEKVQLAMPAGVSEIISSLCYGLLVGFFLFLFITILGDIEKFFEILIEFSQSKYADYLPWLVRAVFGFGALAYFLESISLFKSSKE